MALSINPIVKLAADKLTPGLTSAINQSANNISTGINNAMKDNLNDTVNRLGAGIGSGLNGITAGVQNAASNLSGVVQSSVPIGGLGSISDTVGAVSNLASNAVSGLANGAATAVQNIAAGGLAAASSALSSVSSQLAAAAGMANDLISAARSLNIPKGIPSFKKPSEVVKVTPTKDGDWRVRITAPLGFGEIIFPVIPSMTLGFTANYTNVDIVHSNYPFLAYKNSQPNDITISCEWPVETKADGKEYLQMVLLGRTLTKMFYGQGAEVGQPPPICTLKGYGPSGRSIILPDTPVIVKSFQVDLKDDVSYIQVDNDYVPRLSSVSITVTPTFSRTAQRSFDLTKYRKGQGAITY